MPLTVFIVSLIIGIGCRIIISRNRFNRMSAGGVQQFSSYTKMLIVTTIEKLLFLVQAIAFPIAIVSFFVWVS